MWFYCRAKTIDNPSEILGEAFNVVLHEVCSTQDLYTRAVAHLVYKTIRNKYEEVKQAMADEIDFCDRNQDSFCCFRDREKLFAVVKDFELGMSKCVNGGACLIDEFCAEVGGDIYFPLDFASAIIELNRSIYNFDKLPDETKRKIIFCSDQVMP